MTKQKGETCPKHSKTAEKESATFVTENQQVPINRLSHCCASAVNVSSHIKMTYYMGVEKNGFNVAVTDGSIKNVLQWKGKILFTMFVVV